MLSLSGAMLSLSGAVLSAAGSTRVSPGTVFLGKSSAQNHRRKCCRAVAPSKNEQAKPNSTLQASPAVLQGQCRLYFRTSRPKPNSNLQASPAVLQGQCMLYSRTSRPSQTALFRLLLLCCRGSAGSSHVSRLRTAGHRSSGQHSVPIHSGQSHCL
jgi:hypothetical protein